MRNRTNMNPKYETHTLKVVLVYIIIKQIQLLRTVHHRTELYSKTTIIYAVVLILCDLEFDFIMSQPQLESHSLHRRGGVA